MLSKEQRLELYVKLYDKIKHYYGGRGMCNELMALGYHGSIIDLPELWAKKSKAPYSDGYWWQSYKKRPRLNAINRAIEKARS